MKKLLLRTMLLLCALVVGSTRVWAETATLSNSEIVAAGAAASGYTTYTITGGGGKTWNAYAIKNQHSNATSSYHYLQIKKYEKSTAYYIQVPVYGTKITSIAMTVSSTSNPMNGGGNTATLFFSSSNSTSATGTGVASGTGGSSVTIDCSSLDLNTGYITASGGVRIWDVTVTYSTEAITKVATPTFSVTGGAYLGTKSVSLSCSTAGASIYYTEDGSTPTSSSTLYSSAISVSSNETIKAIAIKAGLDDSDVASEDYIIMPSIPDRTPKNYNSDYFVKVTDVNELENGDAILIVNPDGNYAMAEQNGNFRSCVGVYVDFSDVISPVPATAQKIVIIKANNRFFLSTGDDSYLCATSSSSSSNNIGTKDKATAGENAMASIGIEADGNATIAFLGDKTNNNLRYNYNSGDPRFSCYASTSSMQLVHIYKEIPIATVNINAACNDGDGTYYGTYSNSSAFVVPADLTVSAVNVDGSGKLTITNYSEGDVVKANTGVLVSSTTSGDHTVVLSSETGEEISGNMLKASSVAMTGSNKFYRLTMHNGLEIGFWWGAEGGAAFSIAANKAYLAVPVGAAREGFAFGEETSGISLTTAQQRGEEAIYTLNGQRVQKPTKGLYIVNGKKVVMK